MCSDDAHDDSKITKLVFSATLQNKVNTMYFTKAAITLLELTFENVNNSLTCNIVLMGPWPYGFFLDITWCELKKEDVTKCQTYKESIHCNSHCV